MFIIDEVKEVDEVFIMLVLVFVMFVVEIDGVVLGDGISGELVKCLCEIYLDEVCVKVI